MQNEQWRIGGKAGERGSRTGGAIDLADLLGADFAERYDRFELAQLREVVAACRESRTAAEAGKKLCAVSRKAKKTSNDTDRLAKYLAKFGLSFKNLSGK
jgi:transcriptional regulatory protein RtcR